MLREDLELLGKALMAYKRELKEETNRGTDLAEYNAIEIRMADTLAERLEIDPDYFQPEAHATESSETASPIGWQIVERETDDPPAGMTTYEVYSLETVLAWMQENRHQASRWRLLPIFDGDIEEPMFM